MKINQSHILYRHYKTQRECGNTREVSKHEPQAGVSTILKCSQKIGVFHYERYKWRDMIKKASINQPLSWNAFTSFQGPPFFPFPALVRVVRLGASRGYDVQTLQPRSQSLSFSSHGIEVDINACRTDEIGKGSWSRKEHAFFPPVRYKILKTCPVYGIVRLKSIIYWRVDAVVFIYFFLMKTLTVKHPFLTSTVFLLKRSRWPRTSLPLLTYPFFPKCVYEIKKPASLNWEVRQSCPSFMVCYCHGCFSLQLF